MRSRRDGVDPQASIERALALGLVGFGGDADPPPEDPLARRIARFAAVEEGSFVWTRDANGHYWLGRVDGPYFYDDDGRAVDLVHVRPCRWLSRPLLEHDVPAAVVATFGRGGRNFQQTHHPAVSDETQRIWDSKAESFVTPS
jgi:hypothetical protein